VPIPAPGNQLVTLTHVEDVASMLAAVPGNPAAVRQFYNVCSDRAISFNGELELSPFCLHAALVGYVVLCCLLLMTHQSLSKALISQSLTAPA